MTSFPSSARSISTKMTKLLVNQANRELDASRMYLAMDLWFRFSNYPGSASWCQTHSQEERQHAMKIFDHLSLRQTEKHCQVTADGLTDWSMTDIEANNISTIWKRALDQEVANSRHYFEMCKVAKDENDFVTQQFLDWFMNEQLTEENAVEDIFNKAIDLEQTGGLYAAVDKDMLKMDH